MENSKRKYAEDLYQQAKKQRVANHNTGFGINLEGWSPLEASEDNNGLSSSAEIEMPDESLSASSNERAIVVYRPTNPELFLSQPIRRAPTIELDKRLFPAGMLGPEPLSASDMLQRLGVLNSAPAVAMTDLTSKDIPDNRFAVIPWVASPSSVPATGHKHALTSETSSQIRSEAMKEDADMGEDALESEAMDEDEGAYVLQSSQPSNPTNSFSTEPWQHYGVPLSQFGSVTWSH